MKRCSKCNVDYDLSFFNKDKYSKDGHNGEKNYGWDIDHIQPLSEAKSKEEIIMLNHYTNLQPLCSKINRDIKKNKTWQEVTIH